MLATTEVFQSRWGYHPCDHETFLELKKIHKIFYRAYCDCKRWLRRDAKLDPSYEEPNAPLFMLNHGWKKKGINKDGAHNSFYGYGFVTDNLHVVLYLRVLEEFRNARRPKEKPEEVVPVDLPACVKEMAEKLEAFYTQNDPS